MDKCNRKVSDEYHDVMMNSDDITKVRECRDKTRKTNKDYIKLKKKNDKLNSKDEKNSDRFLKKLSKTKSPSKQKTLVKKRRSYIIKEFLPKMRKNLDKQTVIISKSCEKELSAVLKDTKQKLTEILSKELKCKENYKGQHKQTKLTIKNLKSKKNENLLKELY